MAASGELERVLFVDDEKRVLDGIRRHLRKDFDLSFANGGGAALKEVEKNGPFSVVVSDLQMPGMDGIALLSQVGKRAPETVRMLLTGNADLKAAIKAVNEGCIFRFLTKPCPAEQLTKSVHAAVEQHQLLISERELLEKTLHGSVHVLTEILALAHPDAFGRANRVKNLTSQMLRGLEEHESWRIEMAAMLSQIGAVALPPETAAKVYRREALDDAEKAQVSRLPEVTAEILGNIPRLEEVREMLRLWPSSFDGGGTSDGGPAGADIPLGARILRIAIDADDLDEQGVPKDETATRLRARTGCYDPDVLAALERIRDAEEDDQGTMKTITVKELRSGMVFAQECTTLDGRLLVARGQEVTPGVLERVRNFADNLGVKEPLSVLDCEAGVIS